MSFWTAVVIMTAIWGLVEIYKSRRGITKDWAGNESLAPKEDRETRREIELLRERVKVLERITTDAHTSEALESRRVSEEIDALRDR